MFKNYFALIALIAILLQNITLPFHHTIQQDNIIGANYFYYQNNMRNHILK